MKMLHFFKGLVPVFLMIQFAAASEPNQTDLFVQGTRIDAAEAAALEKEVAADPANLNQRIKLLGYYHRPRISEEPARAAAQAHLLWIIRNRPDADIAGSPGTIVDKHLDPVRYAEAAAAWNDQISKHASDPTVLGNAAAFFILNDPDAAEKLLKQGRALEPKNPEWDQRLGFLYTLSARRTGTEATGAHRKAFEAMDRALLSLKGEKRFYALDQTAEAAFEAGEIDKARAYSKELLAMADGQKNDWNYGNAIYVGNTILGRIALEQNDLTAARGYLLAASQTPGSPQLNSFGPNMTLASELLARGDKEAVLTFLDNVLKFWKMPDKIAKVHGWQEEIRAGKIPKLEPHY